MAKQKRLNIGMIGQGFMGRTHSNAWTQVPRFFDPPLTPVMHTCFGQPEENPQAFADLWGWANISTDYRKLVRSPEIDLVDIVVPNFLHAKVASAALEAGKDVACEKPIARTLDEGRDMVRLAKKAGVRTFIGYNYRRCPAVALAYQLARAGKLGDIRHVQAYYLQDWANDPEVPLAWRFEKKKAGSGSHGDLGAHVIDLCRFVTGEEITEISGAFAETFIKERNLQEGVAAGGIAAGLKSSEKKGKVTVDDATEFLCRFEGGAMGHFAATRFATGNQNKNGFEISGSKGAVRFNFERMNELEYYDNSRPRAVQGWTTIICTHGGDHPYAEAYWPDAHVIGYEHSFINQAYDILRILAGKDPVVPLPDFEDAYQTQRVLEAVVVSAKEKRPVKMREVK